MSVTNKATHLCNIFKKLAAVLDSRVIHPCLAHGPVMDRLRQAGITLNYLFKLLRRDKAERASNHAKGCQIMTNLRLF